MLKGAGEKLVFKGKEHVLRGRWGVELDGLRMCFMLVVVTVMRLVQLLVEFIERCNVCHPCSLVKGNASSLPALHYTSLLGPYAVPIR